MPRIAFVLSSQESINVAMFVVSLVVADMMNAVAAESVVLFSLIFPEVGSAEFVVLANE